MTAEVTLLQRVQETYASVTGLTLWVTCAQGERLTRPSGSALWISDTSQTGEARSRIDQLLESLARTTDYRCDAGLAVTPDTMLYVFPVRDGSSVPYWVMGAGLTEQLQVGGRLLSVQQDKLKELAEIAASLLGAGDRQQRLDHPIDRVHKLLDEQTIFPSEGLAELAIQILMDSTEECTLIGYAEKTKNLTTFVVKAISGAEGSRMEGASFTLGEGLLGQAATSRSPGVWENVLHDPRVSFFTNRGIEPKMVFAFPVHYGYVMEGLLFGLSTTHSALSVDFLTFGRTVASLIGLRLAHQTLQADRDLNFVRLTTLMDMFKTLPSVREVKRVLFILIDLAINMAEAEFACVACRQPDGRLQLVSRGLPREETERYLTELTDRLGLDDGEEGEGAAVVYRNGSLVLECPLTYRGERIGVFAVGLKPQNDTDNFRSYMGTMAVIGSVAIYRLLQEQGDPEKMGVAEALRLTLRQWDAALYEQSERALAIAESFAQEQGYSKEAKREMADLCRLAPFEPTVLKGEGLLPRLRVLQAELREMLLMGKPDKGTSPVGEAVQIAALAWRQAEGLHIPVDDSRFLADLAFRFREHVESRHVIEMVINTGEPEAASATAVPLSGTTDPMGQVRALGLLSKREMDVLGLVATGCSNREIAEKLWISEHTVKNHMTNILAKLGAVDRTQLVAKVYQLGLPGTD